MDVEDRSVTIDELRSILIAALSALESAGVKEIDLENDAYWSVYFEDAFNLGNEPSVVLGSLREELSELRGEMRSLAKDDGISLWHIFNHLGGFVQRLAKESSERGL